jgi:hypothetical protein
MSDIVKFVFYYGSGTVLTNEHGVDLSQFQYVELDLTAPQTWTVSQLKEWLVGCLGLNPETYTVGVHALWTQSSSNIFWVLRPIDRTSKWLRWLQGCEKRGTTPVALLLPVANATNPPEGEGESSYELSNANSVSNAGGGGYESGQSSQAGGEDEYSGEADADEEDGHLQNQMEDEDTDGRSSYTDGSDESDEEEVPIPASWNQDFSSAMTVNDGHDSAWQYHQNNIAKRAIYPDKKHLQDAIISWAMSC